jgi:hypothetical protein
VKDKNVIEEQMKEFREVSYSMRSQNPHILPTDLAFLNATILLSILDEIKEIKEQLKPKIEDNKVAPVEIKIKSK